MTKKILLTCAILFSVHCGVVDTSTIKQEMVEMAKMIFQEKFYEYREFFSPEEFREAAIEGIKKIDVSNIIPSKTRTDISDILLQEIKTLDDCASTWTELYAQIRGQSAEFKKAFYEKHQPKVEELEEFLCKAIRENGGQTSVDIERTHATKIIFLQSCVVDEVITYEKRTPFPSNLPASKDPGYRLNSRLYAHRLDLAGLKYNESYGILKIQQEFRYVHLKEYSTPDWLNGPFQNGPFQFNDPALQHIGPEIDTLFEYLEQLRKKSPTPLEKVIKEYSVHLKELEDKWPKIGGFRTDADKARFIHLYDAVEQKICTNKVIDIVNEGFALNSKWVYPQLLQVLIILINIGDFCIDDTKPDITAEIFVPGYGIKEIEFQIRTWIRAIADDRTYHEVNLVMLEHELRSVLCLAQQDPRYDALVAYSSSFMIYLNRKACQFIQNKHKMCPNFFDLPIDMRT